MMRRSTFAAVLALSLGAATAGHAQTIVTNNASPYNAAPGLTSFQTNYNEVGGMLVEWAFAGGGGGSGTWGDLGGGNWGVSGTNFSLSGTGSDDTYGGVWTLQGANLASFTLRAAPGGGVFDIIGSPSTSPGSSSGWPYEISCYGLSGCNPIVFFFPDAWNTTVTYLNPVGINGAAPLGDLYATMNVAFGTTFNSGSDGDCAGFIVPIQSSGCDYLRFYQDMDNVPRDQGGTVTPTEVVPEPATMTLLATGLAGMAAARRRRKQSK